MQDRVRRDMWSAKVSSQRSVIIYMRVCAYVCFDERVGVCMCMCVCARACGCASQCVRHLMKAQRTNFVYFPGNNYS